MRRAILTLVALAVGALSAIESQAALTAGTIRCKDTTHKIEKAEITLERDGSQVRVQLFKPGDSDYFAALDISLRETERGAGVEHVSYYHLYANCPEMQYNVNRSVGKEFGDHDDFGAFLVELRNGGKVEMKVAGVESMFDNLTWNIEVSGKID